MVGNSTFAFESKNKHLSYLKAILAYSLSHGRYEDSLEIFKLLEKARYKKGKDETFIFKAKAELSQLDGTFSAGTLKYFQIYSRSKVDKQDRKLLSLEASLNYLIRHGRLDDAYELLKGFMSAAPFNKTACFILLATLLLTHTALIAASKPKSRNTVDEKFYRKFLSYLEQWQVVSTDCSREFIDTIENVFRTFGGPSGEALNFLGALAQKFPNSFYLWERLCYYTLTDDNGDAFKFIQIAENYFSLAIAPGAQKFMLHSLVQRVEHRLETYLRSADYFWDVELYRRMLVLHTKMNRLASKPKLINCQLLVSFLDQINL
jgi:hypothetical protein